MNKRIVFFDIDGTLFDNDNDCIHPSTLKALKELQNNEDIYVAIATGRSKKMADEVLKRYQLSFDAYVFINGQMAFVGDELIHDEPLSESFIAEFMAECERLNVPYGLVSHEFTIVSSHDSLVTSSFENFKMELPRLMKPGDLNERYYQSLFFNMDYFDHFQTKFNDLAKFIPWMENNGADIVHPNTSKAIGIAHICEHLGIKQENVYAFGDSSNDVEMIQYAGVGVAMGNAKEELKKVSDFITSPIDEDGLAKALQKYKLI